jgi:hypothetical protein
MMEEPCHVISATVLKRPNAGKDDKNGDEDDDDNFTIGIGRELRAH